MKSPNRKIIADAIDFAARWGFLSQSLFFEFICPMSYVHRYRYWQHLTTAGYFKKSKNSDQVLILTADTRSKMAGLARPARSHFYIKHDEIVARFYLALEMRGLILDSWLEDELMRDPVLAQNVMGTERIHRVPDLIFDLASSEKKIIRCALEIERVTKSQARYSKMALAYLIANKVDIILMGCAEPTTERSLRRSFSSHAHLTSKKTPGIFLFEEFNPESLLTPLRFQNNEINIERFLEIVTKSKVPPMKLSRNKHETAVSRLEAFKKEAV